MEPVVPSLPGCATWGHSQHEAVKALQDAIEAYIATLREMGRPVPQPPPNGEVIESARPCRCRMNETKSHPPTRNSPGRVHFPPVSFIC